MLARYLLKRLALSIPVLFGISILAFLLVRLVPGDTVTVMLGAQYNEEQAQVLREKYGLDRPLPMQYAIWVSNLLRGDFGQSTFTGQPVLTAILERLPVTLELSAISVLFALAVGIPLGVRAAVRRNRWVDYLATVFGLVTLGLGFAIFPIVVAGTGFLYRTATLAGGSATWGMRFTGIEFRRGDGSRFDFMTALLHTTLYAICISVVVLQAISCVAILGSRYRQSLGDMVLGTTAINRPAA